MYTANTYHPSIYTDITSLLVRKILRKKNSKWSKREVIIFNHVTLSKHIYKYGKMCDSNRRREAKEKLTIDVNVDKNVMFSLKAIQFTWFRRCFVIILMRHRIGPWGIYASLNSQNAKFLAFVISNISNIDKY